MFDAYNGNTNCTNADILEIKNYKFGRFDYLRPFDSARIPHSYTKTQVHLIYGYKQDGRYKACMVAFGNITGPYNDTYYSSVISLCSMLTAVLLSELNNIETCKGDICNHAPQR